MIRKVGYRYRPDLGDLLEALKFKANGGEMSEYPNVCPEICPGNIVEIMDMYGEGKEPWNLFSGINEIFELHDVNDWQQRSRVKYLVTKLSKVGPRNYCRGAGAGSWDSQGTKPVEFNGQEIFQMGTLTYEFCGDPSDAAGKPHYWMHEYHLSQQSLGQIGLSSSDYVICRVIKDLSKQCHVKRGKKRVSSSTMEHDLPKKKAKKNVIPQENHESNAVQMNQRYVEGGCSLSLVNEEPFMTLDDFPDDCFATSSGQKEAFLEIPNSTEICDPGCVIDENVEEEYVAGCSSNSLNDLDDTELALEEFSDLLFGNDDEDEEEF